MKVYDLAASQVRRRLRAGSLRLRFGPFVAQVRSPLRQLAEPIVQLYSDYPVEPEGTLTDFFVSLECPLRRRLLRPQARFYNDGFSPYAPMPAGLSFPVLEWGLNWCIATRAHQFVMFHAAVLARGEHAMVLPGVPGAGKSTLTAALSQRGWRLLSDEFTLLRPRDMMITPMPRPVSLKNQSIDIIRAFAPQAKVGPSFPKTHKGTVAHLVPSEDQIDAADQLVTPRWIVFPKFEKDAPLELLDMSRGKSFLTLCSSSFNYEMCGETAFRTVTHLTRSCSLQVLRYGNLDDAVEALAALP